MANSPASRWISPNVGYGTDTGIWADGPGQYVLRLVFDLPANAILDTATFRYQIATDIYLHSVWLNGHRIQSSPAGGYGSFTGPIPVGPSSGLFFATNNSLDVIVVNAGNPGTPDPATGNPVELRFGDPGIQCGRG